MMKHYGKLYFPGMLMAFALLIFSGCYKDGTDHISEEVRISLYPSPLDFMSDGTTVEGAETYSAVVTVNCGASVSDAGWTAEIIDTPAWVNMASVQITSTYPDTWGTGIREYQENGIEISVAPNDGAGRSFTLRVSVPSGEYADYLISQEGVR